MKPAPPNVLAALSPVAEQQVAPLLFGSDAAVRVAASLVELAALERTLSESTEQPEALLVSPDLPELSASLIGRARSRGLRLVGIASDEDDVRLLGKLPLDVVLTPPIDAAALLRAVRSPTSTAAAVAAAGSPRTEARHGTVLAVVGSRGAPGASELACSLAALAGRQWRSLLVELDLLGSTGYALRLGADPAEGSLLALARATRTDRAALDELLDRWLVKVEGWSPVLLAPEESERAIEELDEPGTIRAALEALIVEYPLVVCDVGFLLARPGRPGPVERCHREALLAADAVIAVLGAREAQLDAGLAQLDLLLDTLEIPRERLRVVCTGAGGPGSIPRAQLDQTLTLALRERELATDAVIPWDARALAAAVRTGLPLAVARRRGPYARALAGLLETLFLPGAPVARRRKRLLALPVDAGAGAEPAVEAEEVALPWRS